MSTRSRIRRLPLPLRAAIEIVRPLGEHRARGAIASPIFPQPAVGAAVTQGFRFCTPCGVETAAVLHPSGGHTCTEGHTTQGAR
ncbi:hypothetical protein ACIRQH_34755 [Streptomyces sp. NPDC102279]|uniref:hypothetical protein n=1 Tax=Streptomyces sp. NPDC102279 TaxID=3366153 RepID=UPI00380E0612